MTPEFPDFVVLGTDEESLSAMGDVRFVRLLCGGRKRDRGRKVYAYLR